MSFLGNFLKNSGIWVSVSSVLSKVLAFAMTLFLVRFLPSSDFGVLTITLNFVGFFLPALGLGASHGLLRFGAQQKDEEKANLIRYTMNQGIINQILLSIIIIVSGILLNFSQTIVWQLIAVMTIRLFGLYFLEQAKAELRAKFDNTSYAKIDIFTNILAVVLGVALTYFYGIWGYVISLCLFPFSVFLLYRFDFTKASLVQHFKKEFWGFSVKSVLTTMVFMWVFILDVFFVGRYFSAEQVGLYKISTLIPMNLIFVAQIYTQTLYPEMCYNHRNKNYLNTFLKQYYLYFVPVTVFLVILGFVFAQDLMQIFGKDYLETDIIKIMFLQMASCILMRIPFGNLLGATGEITASLVIGIIILLGITITSLIILPDSSPKTAAYIACFWITFGGVLSATYYFNFFRKLK